MKSKGIGVFVGMLQIPEKSEGLDNYILKEQNVNIVSLLEEFFIGEREKTYGNVDENKLYYPHFYRSFGSHQLHVFALTDDFAFGCTEFTIARIFRSAKTEIFQGLNQIQKIDSFTGTFQDMDINSMWIGERFPSFFGQARLQIDSALVKFGLMAKENVRMMIQQMAQSFNSVSYTILDTYDNDELIVLSFNDDFSTLANFMNLIRNLKDIKNGTAIFCRCHINMGYCVDSSLGDDELLGNVKQVEKHIGCTVELAPGYCCKLPEDNGYMSITGGSKLCLPLENKLNCSQQNILSIKRFLTYNNTLVSDSLNVITVDDVNSQDYRISPQDINEIRVKMRKLGVSRVLRERILHLLYTYDNFIIYNSVRGLKDSFFYINDILDDLSNESVFRIENCLETEANGLECALFNRIPTLTHGYMMQYYNSSSQQLLMVCDRVYHEVMKILNPSDDAKHIYACITGSERVTSYRTHLNLNINHIIYPDLFCQTIWKEASNFSENINDVPNRQEIIRDKKDDLLLFKLWKQFDGMDMLVRRVIECQAMANAQSDDRYSNLATIISDNFNVDFIKHYLLTDFLVFHFAFARDFSMLCHFYLKLLLQTSSLYDRNGIINRSQVVMLFMRLSMIALRADKVDEYKKMASLPKDSLLSSIWLESFSKVFDIAEKIYEILNSYGFRLASEIRIWEIEMRLKLKNGDMQFSDEDLCATLKKISSERSKKISQLSDSLFNTETFLSNADIAEYVAKWRGDIDFIIVYITAFLKKIYAFDGCGDSLIKINSLPRNSKGDRLSTNLDLDRCSPIQADPTGGTFICKVDDRQTYFYMCSVFYKALWHYNCVS